MDILKHPPEILERLHRYVGSYFPDIHTIVINKGEKTIQILCHELAHATRQEILLYAIQHKIINQVKPFEEVIAHIVETALSPRTEYTVTCFKSWIVYLSPQQIKQAKKEAKKAIPIVKAFLEREGYTNAKTS